LVQTLINDKPNNKQMPKNVIVFDLDNEEDVEALIFKFEKFANALRGGEKPVKDYENENEPISEADLCKRIKRKPPTIAAYRSQGMPYIAGKPCTYIYKDVLEWLFKARGIKGIG
jgi:hypothetical protein